MKDKGATESEIMDAISKGKVIIPTGRTRNRKFKDKRRDVESGELITYQSYTVQQDLFCRLKAEGFNDTQAYKRAYPNSNSPHIDGHKLAKQEKIKNRIKQLLKERSQAAQLVSPEESLSRWNFLYLTCMEGGDVKGAMEAQKQIDKINGADQAIVKQQIDMRTLFRGEEDEWKDTASKLMSIVDGKQEKRLASTKANSLEALSSLAATVVLPVIVQEEHIENSSKTNTIEATVKESELESIFNGLPD